MGCIWKVAACTGYSVKLNNCYTMQVPLFLSLQNDKIKSAESRIHKEKHHRELQTDLPKMTDSSGCYFSCRGHVAVPLAALSPAKPPPLQTAELKM